MSAERPPLLPVQLFGELFEYAAPWKHDDKKKPEFKADRVRVSCYLCHDTANSFGGLMPSLEVRPTPAVLEVIGREMMALDRDTIYFRMGKQSPTRRDDDERDHEPDLRRLPPGSGTDRGDQLRRLGGRRPDRPPRA